MSCSSDSLKNIKLLWLGFKQKICLILFQGTLAGKAVERPIYRPPKAISGAGVQSLKSKDSTPHTSAHNSRRQSEELTDMVSYRMNKWQPKNWKRSQFGFIASVSLQSLFSYSYILFRLVMMSRHFQIAKPVLSYFSPENDKWKKNPYFSEGQIILSWSDTNK